MVVVKDQLDPDLRKIIKKQKAVIIPVGSIEQHGPHLPVSTDSDIVYEVARRVSEKCNFLLLLPILKKQKAVIIPVGSIQQHGPHLPVSTDSDIVYEVARRVSEKCNFLLLPTISYGVSFEHAPFFNLSLKRQTLEQ